MVSLPGVSLPCKMADLPSPFFVVNETKVRNNARKMIERCQELGVQLRPHLKTHKTLEGGDILTNGTRRCVDVSTVQEAQFYSLSGYDDILLAQPIIENRIKRCKDLSEKMSMFHVMVDSDYGVDILEENPLKDGRKWSVYLKVDCGAHRAGILWDSPNCIALAKRLQNSKFQKLTGLYVFGGDAYGGTSVDDIFSIGKVSGSRLTELVNRLQEAGVAINEVSIGSTPACSHLADELKHVTEIHPGNYVFYDFQQVTLGSCSLEEVACKVATRILGHYPHRNQMLIDCGWTALSLDRNHDQNAHHGYGLFQDHPELKLTQMTQEVGFVDAVDGMLDYSKYPIGSLLFIYPWHSCATAMMHSVYYLQDNGDIVGTWKPTRGW